MSPASQKGQRVGRDGQGRFTTSGNPKGRPRKVDTSLPAGRRKAIASVADRKVTVRVTGDGSGKEVVTEMTVFEACVYQLGLIGAGGHRLAAKDFVHLALHNSMAMESRARMEEMQARTREDPFLIAAAEAHNRRREEFIASLYERFPDRDDEVDEDHQDPLDEVST